LNTWGCNDMTWHNTCTFECGQHEPLAACCPSDRNSGNCRHPRELLAFLFSTGSIDTRFVSPTLKQTAEAVEGFAQTVSNSSTIHVCICAGSCTCCRNPSDTSAVTQPLHPLHQLHLSAPVPIESLQLAAKMRIQNRFGKGHQVVLLADISDTADSQSNFSSTQSESWNVHCLLFLCRGFVHLCWLSSAGSSHSWTADLKSDFSDFTNQYFRDFRLLCAELHSFSNETTECLSATGLSGSVAESLCAERCLECQGCRRSKPFATESTWWFRGPLR
jgi:hypothetical protein